MAQASLLGYFDQDFKKKVIPQSKHNFVSKHKKLKTIKKVKVQQFLQVGQKLEPSKCSICGMMYTRGIKEDELLHNKFHKDFEQELIIPKWKNENILWKDDKNHYKIIEITNSSPQNYITKIESVLKCIDRKLDLIEQSENFFLNNKCKVYICLDKQRKIISCIAAESVKEGYFYDFHNNEIKDHTNVECGINRFWIKENLDKEIIKSLIQQVQSNYLKQNQKEYKKLKKKNIAISKFIKLPKDIYILISSKESKVIKIYS